MEDRNEAIVSVLDSELAAAFVGSELDLLQTRNRHKMVMRSGYISCWTRSPENIAVWSIYSPNKDRVMVRTTVGKLKAALDDLDESSLGLSENILLKNKDVSSVDYVNLHELKVRWSRKAEDMREAKKKDSLAGILDGTRPAEATQLRKLRYSEDLHYPYLRKDKRYMHEREVRAVFELKARAEPATERPELEAMPFLSRGETPICEQDKVPKQIEIPIGEEFIEDILLDGRMVHWQREAVEFVLRKFDRTAKVSRAFSS